MRDDLFKALPARGQNGHHLCCPSKGTGTTTPPAWETSST